MTVAHTELPVRIMPMISLVARCCATAKQNNAFTVTLHDRPKVSSAFCTPMTLITPSMNMHEKVVVLYIYEQQYVFKLLVLL